VELAFNLTRSETWPQLTIYLKFWVIKYCNSMCYLIFMYEVASIILVRDKDESG